jgi:hypothetical protein
MNSNIECPNEQVMAQFLDLVTSYDIGRQLSDINHSSGSTFDGVITQLNFVSYPLLSELVQSKSCQHDH